MVLGLLIGSWAARYLGPAQYGELAYVIAYLAFFQVVATLGLDGIVGRDIARDRTLAAELLGTALFLRVAVGILCWLVAVGGMAWASGWHDRGVWITALVGGTLVFQAADTIDLWFHSQSQSRHTVIAKLLALLLSSGIKVALILGKAPLLAFAAVTALDALIVAVGMLVAYRRYPCEKSWELHAVQAKRLLHQSWPLIISGLSVTFYSRVDQLLIRQLLGEHALGIYTAALPFTVSWIFIPAIIMTSAAPIMAKLRVDDQRRYQIKVAALMRLNVVIALAIALPIGLFSATITDLFLGDAYGDSAGVLSVLVFANLIVFLGVVQSVVVINEGWRWIVIASTASAAASSLALNLLLIPLFGLLGAAYASVVTLLVSVTVVPLLLSKDLRGIYRYAVLGRHPG
ncbi:flippase [Pseudomonas sp. N040]|nr:flippase [Pseudomonas sp. N040]MBW7014180.1 flippase [Pseudomonas sp. N040]